jgi:hypothetical protein
LSIAGRSMEALALLVNAVSPALHWSFYIR